MELKAARELAFDIAKKVEQGTITNFEFELEGLKIKVERQMSAPAAPVAVTAAVVAPAAVSEEPVSGQAVKSPLVGSFYASPAPGEAPFVAVGSEVHKGDTLCIVEAMKMLNTIESPCSGTVTGILVTDGQMVEFGQVLMIIE